MKADVRKASLSAPKGGASKCEGDSVASVGSPVTVKKASLAPAKGGAKQFDNPKR